MTKEKKKGIATVFTRQLGSGLSGRPVGNFENQFLFENRKKEKERKCNLAVYDVYTLQLQIYLFINLKILNNSTTNTRLIWYSSIQTLPLPHLNSVSIVTLQSSLLLDLSNTHFSLSLSHIYTVFDQQTFFFVGDLGFRSVFLFSSYTNRHLPLQLPFPLFSDLHLRFCVIPILLKRIWSSLILRFKINLRLPLLISLLNSFFFLSVTLKMAGPESPNGSLPPKRFGITKPISVAGPTETDFIRNIDLEKVKFLYDLG